MEGCKGRSGRLLLLVGWLWFFDAQEKETFKLRPEPDRTDATANPAKRLRGCRSDKPKTASMAGSLLVRVGSVLSPAGSCR